MLTGAAAFICRGGAGSRPRSARQTGEHVVHDRFQPGVAVDEHQVGPAQGQVVAAHLFQEFLFFEQLGHALAGQADARQRPLDVDVDDEHDVGLGGEAAVGPEDRLQVQPARSLVAGVGIIVPVHDDRRSRAQRRQDVGFHVPAPVLEKEVQFFLDRDGVLVLGQAADLFSQRRIGRLAQPDGRDAAAQQMGEEQPGQGGLARAVDAFEDDQLPHLFPETGAHGLGGLDQVVLGLDPAGGRRWLRGSGVVLISLPRRPTR